MFRSWFEQALVLVVGFFLGAGVAISVTPGDLLFTLVVGFVVSLFCREYFLRAFGGELLHPSRHTKPSGPKPAHRNP